MKNHDSLLNGFTLVHFPGQAWDSIGFQELTFQEVFCYDSKRKTSNSIDGFKPICPIFPSESLYIKSMFFELFGAYLEGNAVSSTKGCARGVSLQNAVHDKSHPETRSLCAFCRGVVPTQLFTNTALYYKMMLESEPTPLATKWFGGFYDGSKANVGHYKMTYVTIL